MFCRTPRTNNCYMTKSFHFRFEPKNLPGDWRDDSLHHAAVWLNKDTDIPVVFPQDSLDYLLELGYLLPRRGIMFTSAREFIDQLAIGEMAPCDVADVNELRDIRKRKEDSVAYCDFDTARALRDRQHELQENIAKLAVHEVTRANIVDALVRDGVVLDDDNFQSG